MKTKKNLWVAAAVLSAAMLLGGCGGSEPTKEVGEMEKIETTEGTEKTEGAEKVETGETETQTQPEETKEAEQESVGIRAAAPYVFSEGYAWVQLEDANQMALVDTDGKIRLILDETDVSAKVSPVYDGAFAVWSSYGYAIYSTAGELLASSDDGDDSTDFRLRGAAGGSYWIEKTTATISERSTVQYLIDKNGNKLIDEFALDSHQRVLAGDGKLLDIGNLEYSSTSYSSASLTEVLDVLDARFKFLGIEARYLPPDVSDWQEFSCGNVLLMNEADEVLVDSKLYVKIFYDIYDDHAELKSNGRWVDKNGDLVTVMPEGLPLSCTAGDFKGGFAPIWGRGMDNKLYVTVIDKTGSLVYELVDADVEKVQRIWFRDGVIAFEGRDASGEMTYHLIDKDGTLLDASGDISAFTGSITAADSIPYNFTYDDSSYVRECFTINEGFKCIDGVFSRLDGTPFDQAVIDDSTVHIQFTQGYKK